MNWFVLVRVVLLGLENVQTGWVVEDEDENEEEDEWPGSWVVSFRFCACLRTMNPQGDSGRAVIFAGDTPTANTPARMPALPGSARVNCFRSFVLSHSGWANAAPAGLNNSPPPRSAVRPTRF